MTLLSLVPYAPIIHVRFDKRFKCQNTSFIYLLCPLVNEILMKSLQSYIV